MHTLNRTESFNDTRHQAGGPMRHLSILLAALVTCAVLLEADASAQGTSPEVQSQTPSEGAAPPPPNTLLRPYDQYDLDEAKRQSRAVRNGLIGTSAAFALGAILGGVGASQCTYFTNLNGSQDVDCNKAGDVLLPLGGTIAGLSAIGMITTGVMLGVRNKHKRDIEREIRRRYSERRLHFDDESGSLVF
jgi:hypothetical protein